MSILQAVSNSFYCSPGSADECRSGRPYTRAKDLHCEFICRLLLSVCDIII